MVSIDELGEFIENEAVDLWIECHIQDILEQSDRSYTGAYWSIYNVSTTIQMNVIKIDFKGQKIEITNQNLHAVGCEGEVIVSKDQIELSDIDTL